MPTSCGLSIVSKLRTGASSSTEAWLNGMRIALKPWLARKCNRSSIERVCSPLRAVQCACVCGVRFCGMRAATLAHKHWHGELSLRAKPVDPSQVEALALHAELPIDRLEVEGRVAQRRGALRERVSRRDAALLRAELARLRARLEDRVARSVVLALVAGVAVQQELLVRIVDGPLVEANLRRGDGREQQAREPQHFAKSSLWSVFTTVLTAASQPRAVPAVERSIDRSIGLPVGRAKLGRTGASALALP